MKASLRKIRSYTETSKELPPWIHVCIFDTLSPKRMEMGASLISECIAWYARHRIRRCWRSTCQFVSRSRYNFFEDVTTVSNAALHLPRAAGSEPACGQSACLSLDTRSTRSNIGLRNKMTNSRPSCLIVSGIIFEIFTKKRKNFSSVLRS